MPRVRESGRERRTLSREGLLELDAPLGLGAVHLEHGDAHDEDHYTRDQLEDTCAERDKREEIRCVDQRGETGGRGMRSRTRSGGTVAAVRERDASVLVTARCRAVRGNGTA